MTAQIAYTQSAVASIFSRYGSRCRRSAGITDAKREAVKLLAQDASPDPLLEAIRLLADALIETDLAEVLSLWAQNANEKFRCRKTIERNRRNIGWGLSGRLRRR
jgi:hypothetical protein